jgi:carboxymethylenebutenolidase
MLLMCCRTDIDCAVAYGTYIEHNIREARNLRRPFVLHMAMKDRCGSGRSQRSLGTPVVAESTSRHPQISGSRSPFARIGGRTYSKPEADRAFSLTIDFFNRHLA